jgi:predicted component of type VI protein secretion system
MAPQSYLLIMRTGPNPGKSFELTKNELYIGRDINNDIVINDSEISRKHARLILQAGGYVLEDLGSTNGSFVNGQRLMGPHVLRPGELIMLGENVSLAFESGYDADATMVAGSVQTATYIAEAPPQPQASMPPVQAQPQMPVYTGQVPAGPAEPYYEPVEEPQKTNRTMLYAGIGCLVVLLCGMAVAAAFIFDTLNLYCTPPFNMLFPCG